MVASLIHTLNAICSQVLEGRFFVVFLNFIFSFYYVLFGCVTLGKMQRI